MSEANIKAELTQSLKSLHLPTIRQCYEEVARQAERETLSYERYLHELVERECEERQENRMSKLLRESQLPLEKSLGAFDTRRLPPKAARQMRGLLDGSFLKRTENVLVFGNPGSGKTHLLEAVGQELIRQGHRLWFTTCERLVQELLIAKRDLKLSKLIKKYARYEGMIIDDLGYIRQTREEMEVVFSLLAERYERGSVLLTSNLPFSKWEGIFKDPMTTAAAIDRLVHHSIIIELNIPSYRLEQAKGKLQPAEEEATDLPRPAATASGELPCRVGATNCSAAPLTEPFYYPQLRPLSLPFLEDGDVDRDDFLHKGSCPSVIGGQAFHFREPVSWDIDDLRLLSAIFVGQPVGFGPGLGFTNTV